MTTHLSVRLAWHDRGWDGRVCDKPHLNAHCIVHKYIRESRDDDMEREAAGMPLADLDGDSMPPCSREPGTYADQGFVITHHDPLSRGLSAVDETVPPYSTCPAPYRWMLEEFFREICEAEDLFIPSPSDDREGGWVREPDRQQGILRHFWQ